MEFRIGFLKYLPVLMCLIPGITKAQTQADYEHTMMRFAKYYDAAQTDSINEMFGVSDSARTEPFWTNNDNLVSLVEYGRIQTFRYLGIDLLDPDKVAVFKVKFSKAGEKPTSFTLDKNGRFGLFRFITTSAGAGRLMEKDK